MKNIFLLLPFFLLQSVQAQTGNIYVLGIAQDGGAPHAGCRKDCCFEAWKNKGAAKMVVALAITDSVSGKWWLVEATPDIKYQLQLFHQLSGGQYKYLPDGILITHAHIGHYTGLMHLGKEVMNTKNIPVIAMPGMISFLKNNGPWSQLINQQNIKPVEITENELMILSDKVQVAAFKVPHRDEFSETAGFQFYIFQKKLLFIPDINKWELWDKDLIEEIEDTDIAFLDATFYDETELPGRNMKEVPHPLVSETMELTRSLSLKEKSKIHFIHLNHTNPLLRQDSLKITIMKNGYQIAEQGKCY